VFVYLKEIRVRIRGVISYLFSDCEGLWKFLGRLVCL